MSLELPQNIPVIESLQPLYSEKIKHYEIDFFFTHTINSSILLVEASVK